MNASSLHVYGSFYLRSRILSLLWEFFNQAKVSGFSIHKDGKPDSPEVTIEQHLVAHIRGHFPNLRDFASQYCLSEETLKRRFKKRYGMSMYQYFINKKMEYAFKLLQQQGLSLPEVARMIGYKKPYPFIKMFDRYVNTSSASG
jgi:AraC-like DNA-binding protein